MAGKALWTIEVKSIGRSSLVRWPSVSNPPGNSFSLSSDHALAARVQRSPHFRRSNHDRSSCIHNPGAPALIAIDDVDAGPAIFVKGISQGTRTIRIRAGIVGVLHHLLGPTALWT